jgi:hypothetical protein
MAVRVSITILAAGDRQLGQMTKASSVLCEVIGDPKEVGISVRRVHSILHKDLNMQYHWFEKCQLLVKKCLAKHNVTALEHSTYFSDVSQPDFSYFSD